MHALLVILGVFALILALARCKVPLALAIVIGAVATGICFGLGPTAILQACFVGAVKPRTLSLLFIMSLQLMLSGTMEASGQMQRIVDLARAILRRPALAMVALPALIGFLPMPGGALFSAPMVASATGQTSVPASKLSAINFWFRHIWEHWWPVYPGVMLAMTLTGRSFASFAATQIPLGLIMAASGLMILRDLHPDLHTRLPSPPAGVKRRMLFATAPIWIIVLIAIPGSIMVQHVSFGNAPAWLVEVLMRFAPVGIGLVAAMAWILPATHTSLARSVAVLAQGKMLSMLGLLLSVMVFQHMLDHVGAAGNAAKELQALNVPVLLVVAVLPCIAGAITGTAFGFVGTSFPIILPLIAATVPGGSSAAYVALAYAFGHMGQMLSPLHICYVVSNQYFGTPFGPVYREILPPALLTIFVTILYVAALALYGI